MNDGNGTPIRTQAFQSLRAVRRDAASRKTLTCWCRAADAENLSRLPCRHCRRHCVRTFLFGRRHRCEACHGGAPLDLEHACPPPPPPPPPAQAIRDRISGMACTGCRRLWKTRAALCLSLPLRTSDQFATHAIMAACHPTPDFELEAFLAAGTRGTIESTTITASATIVLPIRFGCRGQLLARQRSCWRSGSRDHGLRTPFPGSLAIHTSASLPRTRPFIDSMAGRGS